MLKTYRTIFGYDVAGTSARKALRQWSRKTKKQRNQTKFELWKEGKK